MKNNSLYIATILAFYLCALSCSQHEKGKSETTVNLPSEIKNELKAIAEGSELRDRFKKLAGII